VQQRGQGVDPRRQELLLAEQARSRESASSRQASETMTSAAMITPRIAPAATSAALLRAANRLNSSQEL
jgi:uncharacterized membrane-anchored protein